MSTSPSWFDQEKFSRLAKKVGSKTASASGSSATNLRPLTVPRSAPRTPEKETSRLRRAPSDSASSEAAEPESKVSTLKPISSIPTVDTMIGGLPPEPIAPASESSPAPLPSSGGEAVPSAPRRTSPLPHLKPIFEYDKPVQRSPEQSQPVAVRPLFTPPAAEVPVAPEAGPESSFSEEKETSFNPPPQDFTAPTPSSTFSPETVEPAPSTEDWESASSLKEKLAHAIEERDDARNAADLLRAQLLQADESSRENESRPPGASGTDELSRALDERDGARRDYAKLREQFEILKQEQVRLRGQGGGTTPESSGEIESLRAQLAEREEEIHDLKMGLPDRENDDDMEILKLELNAAQGQVIQAREETSIAQRGLALSQKALQETRDALREASESASQSKTKLESVKKECATLSQQNMLLQAQHDQLSRELAALKAKLTSRV